MKKLYMIGNSHIDPVWFWDWDEGMQEVKATFSSALERMNEYPEMKFTSTSSVFFEWIEEISPTLFEEIRKRIKEERWELAGGWFIEPDCILPCGEAFVRQSLYGQRYFKEKFGIMCTCGSNVDSFGHNETLPQILKKSGMDNYISMRPRLDTPLFIWESKDGSCINTISLPADYTTWFYETTKQNIEQTILKIKELHGLPCCYGVGNHGGGPTKQNIETIQQLKKEYSNIELEFSTFKQFFDSLTKEEKENLPIIKSSLEKVNTGCYSMDSRLKKMNRLSEKRLLATDIMLAIELCTTEKQNKNFERMKELWKTLLFNQFHDTLGGTTIKEARDETILQLSKICANCKEIWSISIQNIMNQIDTTGDGFPLFLFNPNSTPYNGYVSVELNWFCKDSLKLLNPDGIETQYQRIHTKAKTRNYNLGGRRGIVFYANIPAFGFSIYRACVEETTLCDDVREVNNSNPYILENQFIKAEFNKDGMLCSLYDKVNNYESLKEAISFDIWIDERDTWGGNQGLNFGDTKERFKLKSIEVVEDGKIRKAIRVIYTHGESKIEQIYYLYNSSDELVVENNIFWTKEWHLLKYHYPINITNTTAISECSYGTVYRDITDTDEYFMHRFLDVTNNNKEGLFIANDGKYSFNMEDNNLFLTVVRSAIYAQGNSKNWYNSLESYEYTDIGKQSFNLILKPHKESMSQYKRYELATKVSNPYLYILDNCHKGLKKQNTLSIASIDCENVLIVAIKKAEDDNDLIIRLLEIDNKDTKCILTVKNNNYPINISHNEIQTLKINLQTNTAKVVNLLEL